MAAGYLERILDRSFHELLNEGRVSPRTDHLLWRLESALGNMPVGCLLDLLEPGPQLDFRDFGQLRESLADDALAFREWEEEGA